MFYYSATGETFISKIAALEHKQKTGSEIFLYYHDDKYKKIDWSIEPSTDLQELYKLQAERLRAKYDYLILCYSGGYDSTNILETFHFNKIPLDKIIIVGAFNQDTRSGVDENHNGELYHNAFPYIQELGLESITEKHDYSQLFDNPENFSVMEYGDDWIDHVGSWHSPHNWFWRDIEKYVIPKNIGSKRVGLIFGRDKPTLIGNAFTFHDSPVTSYGAKLGTLNCDRVNFYWDPEYPDILLKQLHILKRFSDRVSSIHQFDAKAGAQTFRNISVNRIIYDLKKPLLFKSPKSKSSLFSARDVFLGRDRSTLIFKRHAAGLARIHQRVGLAAMPAVVSSRSYVI